MDAARDANGNQVANAVKFPQGFKAVADFIHSLGMKSGLYTAKGPNTCAGFAASCQHEALDALQWASWGIDYVCSRPAVSRCTCPAGSQWCELRCPTWRIIHLLFFLLSSSPPLLLFQVKDDSCSNCRNDDNLDYSTMWQAIQDSGREMVLTVEGDPDDALITRGGYGNAKRVGHDISPIWMSMVSLVDIGSGLWMWAHNSTNSTVGGFWNDLDMIEVGNAPDFACGADADSLARCQAHMTMWCIMKAPLILGNDIPNMDAATLGVLANKEAIAVNQDAWGAQARRVSVQRPANSTLGASPFDNIAVVAPCDAASPTQAWKFVNTSGGAPDGLYLQPCDASNVYQQWVAVGPTLKNVGAGACIDSSGRQDPGQVLACDATKSSQHWVLQQASGHVANGGACLDIFNFAGPDVFIGSCKVPGNQDSNQVFVSIAGNLLRTNDTGAPANSCLAVASGPPGGKLQTTDATGATYCLTNHNGAEGTWGGGPCDSSNRFVGSAPLSFPRALSRAQHCRALLPLSQWQPIRAYNARRPERPRPLRYWWLGGLAWMEQPARGLRPAAVDALHRRLQLGRLALHLARGPLGSEHEHSRQRQHNHHQRQPRRRHHGRRRLLPRPCHGRHARGVGRPALAGPLRGGALQPLSRRRRDRAALARPQPDGWRGLQRTRHLVGKRPRHLRHGLCSAREGARHGLPRAHAGQQRRRRRHRFVARTWRSHEVQSPPATISLPPSRTHTKRAPVTCAACSCRGRRAAP